MERQETSRFAKWLDIYAQFVNQSTPIIGPIDTKGIVRRTTEKEKVKWYHFPTQQIRRDIVRGLGDLYDIALGFARDTELSLREREKWGRLAAYVAQTINSVTRSYDEVRIEQTLDELKKYVEENIRA